MSQQTCSKKSSKIPRNSAYWNAKVRMLTFTESLIDTTNLVMAEILRLGEWPQILHLEFNEKKIIHINHPK